MFGLFSKLQTPPPVPFKRSFKKTLRLIRVYESNLGYGTFGVIVDEDGEEVCKTAELNWRSNHRNISCIPTGVYNVEPHNSPTFGKCFLVEGVPDREHILFHFGNWAGKTDTAGMLSNTNGCILPGVSVREIQNHKTGIRQVGVTGSGDTMRMLLRRYPVGFTLIVEGV